MIAVLMKHLLRRLQRHKHIPVSALWNCHAKGVHSIVLQDEPGNRIRMFFTDADHELHYRPEHADNRMKLAIHPHHCDVTLIRLFGTIRNEVFRMYAAQNGQFLECDYVSAITAGGTGKLVQTGRKFRIGTYRSKLLDFDGEYMPANALHTIRVPKGEMAAWLVIEGAEDPNYMPICYTTNPKFDSSGLYQPMDRDEAMLCVGHVIERHVNGRV